MITALGFVLASSVGALIRAAAGRRWNRPGGFAAGTLGVNVVGSFLLGLMIHITPPALTVLGVGALGACTTFSSFARDVVALTEARQVATAVSYVVMTCGLGIGAAALGMALAF